ncbi:MAG: response regulator [Parvularculaceae bacterium]
MATAPQAHSDPENASNEADRQEAPIFTILVAEDNDVNIKVLEALLKNFNGEVVVAKDGRKAVSLYEQRRPGLVLMDVNMPEMDGFDATRQIRRREKAEGKPETPIIAVTGHVEPADQHLCIQAGMTDYLHKPVSLQDLVRAVRTWAPALQFAKRAPGPPTS